MTKFNSDYDNKFTDIISNPNNNATLNEKEYIRNFIKEFILKNNLTVKYSRTCNNFFGVRLKSLIIICSNSFSQGMRIGDLIYFIFHEFRHEEQMTKLNHKNIWEDDSIIDFEVFFNEYWKLEIDADNFGKKVVSELSEKCPKLTELGQFKLNFNVVNYQSFSKYVKIRIHDLYKEYKSLDNPSDDIILKKLTDELTDLF